jgi:hypothetical protein
MDGEPDGGDGGKDGMMPTGGTPPMGGAGGAGGSGGAGSGGGGTGGSPVCAEITMAAFVDSILDDSVLPAVAAYDFGIVPALGTTVQDFFEIQFWDSQGSGSYDGALTGSFPLGPGPDSNYAFCSRCVVVFQDYGSATREKMFFATEGTLNVALGSQQMLGYPDMTLTDVTLSEVTIDENGISTLVPGGECLHLETASHRIPPPDDWTCNIAWYMDADCDCGCGQFDPTCTSSQLAACRYCWCDTLSACAAGEVDPASNWQCN